MVDRLVRQRDRALVRRSALAEGKGRVTIIAAAGDMMAADSASFQNDLMFKSVEPKIIRTPCGGLIGATGASGDAYILRHWVAAGMAFDKPPKFSWTNIENDSSILWLWLKPDLTVWMGDATMNHWLVPSPSAVGYGTQYLHGLLDCGATLESAVRRTIARMPYLGGEVQVEQLTRIHSEEEV